MIDHEELQRELRRHREGLQSRKNRVEDYFPLMIPYFEAIRDGRFDEVPSPLCVQLQVASGCSTHCRMCQHWMDKPHDLDVAVWQKILQDLAASGVRSVIFSGGEPLQRRDLDILLREAASLKLHVGLLTSGSGVAVDSPAVIQAIGDIVDWIAISIDGTQIEDRTVRNPAKGIDRYATLKRIVKTWRDAPRAPRLSATVTLQNANIDMDLQAACRFIQRDIGIPQVHFKLATGAIKSLHDPPDYLLSEQDVHNLLDFVWQNHLPQETRRVEGSQDESNNLAYLRRAFAAEVFAPPDVQQGVPVRSFYAREQLRCFTPFIFSLIDSDGSVFPCCHLFRDNHGKDKASAKYRKWHRMGSVLDANGESDFRRVWTGEAYAKERKALEVVSPDRAKFEPCGECTRHCQHNLALTRLYDVVKDGLDELPSVTEPRYGIWF